MQLSGDVRKRGTRSLAEESRHDELDGDQADVAREQASSSTSGSWGYFPFSINALLVVVTVVALLMLKQQQSKLAYQNGVILDLKRQIISYKEEMRRVDAQQAHTQQKQNPGDIRIRKSAATMAESETAKTVKPKHEQILAELIGKLELATVEREAQQSLINEAQELLKLSLETVQQQAAEVV